MEENISVIIVTFNSEETIKKCLESVFKYAPGVEVLVVDNDSQDQTKEKICKFGKRVTLIESKENLGFAKACNLAAKQTSGKFVLFLNPDAYLTRESSIEKLVAVLVENSQYGLVGPKLVLPSGEAQKTVRNLPTVWRAFKEYILGIKGEYDFYQPKCETLCSVESLVGACMLIKKDVYSSIGGFDEKYFLYYEDLEFCKSVLNKGLRIGYLPEVEVEHVIGVSGKNQKTSQLLYLAAKKYHGLLSFYLIQLIIRLGRKLHG